MDTHAIRRGAVAGAAGGMAMAMWSMIVLAATGDGFWRPVNLIAHLGWSSAPLDGSFSAGALAIGLMAHMALAMMLGVAISLIAARFDGGTAATLLISMGVAMAAWIGGAIVWNAIDSQGFDAFTPWVLATGHLMYGMAAGAVLITFEHLHRDDVATVPPQQRVAAA